MTPTPDGQGYWMLGSDGGIFTFGDAVYHGSLRSGPSATPVAAMAATPDGGGYWLLDPDAWNYSFANPPPLGTFPGSSTIVASVASQVEPDTFADGQYCNAYGPCEEWCALFATWAWQTAGYAIPSYAFTGDIYTWAAANGAVLSADQLPVPGDVVLYGTGPWSTDTSVHVGVITQVWPDGAYVSVDGDSGPSDSGWLSVVVNGPFSIQAAETLPNTTPIYAFAQP
jgi:hypothetical protein